MEIKEPLIEELNKLTDNKYKFMLKSATLDEGADFCVIEIFYKDGEIIDKAIKDKLNNFIVDFLPKSFKYDVTFVKNFISEERVEKTISDFIKKEFASVAFRVDEVKLENREFTIKLALDNLSYEYAVNKDIKKKIYNNLKLLSEDSEFKFEIYSDEVFKIDERQEMIDSYKEEEIDASQFRKIDFFDAVPLVNEEIVAPASYIVDKKQPEENVTLCGKVKFIKTVIIKRKPKEQAEGEQINAGAENVNNLESVSGAEIVSTENAGSEGASKNEQDGNAEIFGDADTNNKSKELIGEIAEQLEKLKEEVDSETEQPAKYERKLFKWVLEDITSTIPCVFMSNKENQIKLEELKDGAVVALHGKTEIDNFSGDVVMRVKDISYCQIPEDLKEYIVYKKEKPFYEFVEPQPVVVYQQDNLLNFAEEKVVPKFLQGKTFVCYDLETTGFHFDRGDRMVEIGAVKIVDGKITEKFVTYVNPDGKKFDPKASEVTGIYDADVLDAPMDYQVLQDFYKFAKDSTIIGYNNINFDNVFLLGQGKACRWNFDNPTEDVFRYAQKYVTGVKNYKLGTIAEKLGVTLENAHSAIYDAMATAEIFIKLAERIVE